MLILEIFIYLIWFSCALFTWKIVIGLHNKFSELDDSIISVQEILLDIICAILGPAVLIGIAISILCLGSLFDYNFKTFKLCQAWLPTNTPKQVRNRKIIKLLER